MKKLLLITAVAFLTQYSAKAQTIEITGKGTFKATGIFNNEISDAGDELDYDIPSFGYSYGAGFGMFFTPSIGFGVELLMGQHSGKYAGVIGTYNYNIETIVKSLDIPVLFKLQTKTGGAFIDLGVQYSIINDVTTTWSDNSGDPEMSENMTKYYNSSNLAALLGFGVNIDLSEKLFLTTGLRFEYGLSDIVKDKDMGDYNGDGTKEKTFTGAAGISLGLMYRMGK